MTNHQDIVERLHDTRRAAAKWGVPDPVFAKAASEITQLRTDKEKLQGDRDELVDFAREQITHALTRIDDGKELGATVWRIALEDVVRETRALLTRLEKTS